MNLYTNRNAQIYRICGENNESQRPKKIVYSARRKRNAKKRNIIFNSLRNKEPERDDNNISKTN